jgi:hypothetical protein
MALVALPQFLGFKQFLFHIKQNHTHNFTRIISVVDFVDGAACGAGAAKETAKGVCTAGGLC